MEKRKKRGTLFKGFSFSLSSERAPVAAISMSTSAAILSALERGMQDVAIGSHLVPSVVRSASQQEQEQEQEQQGAPTLDGGARHAVGGSSWVLASGMARATVARKRRPAAEGAGAAEGGVPAHAEEASNDDWFVHATVLCEEGGPAEATGSTAEQQQKTDSSSTAASAAQQQTCTLHYRDGVCASCAVPSTVERGLKRVRFSDFGLLLVGTSASDDGGRHGAL
jgi:hypothetical protein